MGVLCSVYPAVSWEVDYVNTYLNDDAQLIRDCLPSAAEPPVHSEKLFLLYALLLRAKGAAVTLSDVHDAWAAWMLLDGHSHPALISFQDLPAATQRKDEPYLIAIHRAARGGARRNIRRAARAGAIIAWPASRYPSARDR